ncbi:MAG: bifunctional DNA primase/polymerase [Rhizobiaceae bacterium]
MADEIFGTYALKYANLGYPTTPVRNGTKRPVRKGWPDDAKLVDAPAPLAQFAANYASYGIAVITGSEVAQGKFLIGVDIDDDRLVRPIMALFENDVVAKRGGKGLTVFGVVENSDLLKSTTFEGQGDLKNVDLLGSRKMAILPPTIHEVTKEPYRWIDRKLDETSPDQLPQLDERKLNVIKVTVESEYLPALIGGTETHTAAAAFVAQLVRAQCTDEEISAVLIGALPENYSGNTLDELPELISSARAKGFGDPLPTPKGDKQSAKLLLAVAMLDMFLFHDRLGFTYASFADFHNGCIPIRLDSAEMQRRLQFLYYSIQKQTISKAALTETIGLLDARARFKGPLVDVHIRVAEYEGAVYIDRGAGTDSFIKIARDGYEICGEAPVKFIRPVGFECLPKPESDAEFDTDAVWRLFGLDGRNATLLLAFLLMTLNPRGPYMHMLISGAQGSGKSKLCEFAKCIVDPSAVAKQRFPRTEHDLVIQAQSQRVLVYDNASSISHEMSDALCTMATGGSFVTRKLYTDSDSQLFTQNNPAVINGIGDIAFRPDLLERSIQLKLSAMPEGSRRTEKELDSAFESLLPGLLDYLYNCVAGALREINNVDVPRSIRMADAAHWVVAAEHAADLQSGSFLQALEDSQTELMTERAQNDPLGIVLQKVLIRERNRCFDGRVGELFEKLQAENEQLRYRLPRAPAALSNALKRAQPVLQKVGVQVEFGTRSNQGSMVKVCLDSSWVAPTDELEV